MRLPVLVVLALVLLPAAPARALFHLWAITEVYSDPSGEVQFLELFTNTASQQFVGGHPVFTSAGGDVLQTFVIPAHLPGNSTNRHFLLATPGFLEVAGIEPDYELPAGFIELGVADEIAFDSVDSLALSGLPTDGTLSLLANGTTATPTPTNFAGEVGTIDLPEPQTSCVGLVVAGVLAGLAAWQARRARRG